MLFNATGEPLFLADGPAMTDQDSCCCGGVTCCASGSLMPDAINVTITGAYADPTCACQTERCTLFNNTFQLPNVSNCQYELVLDGVFPTPSISNRLNYFCANHTGCSPQNYAQIDAFTEAPRITVSFTDNGNGTGGTISTNVNWFNEPIGFGGSGCTIPLVSDNSRAFAGNCSDALPVTFSYALGSDPAPISTSDCADYCGINGSITIAAA